MFVFGLLSFLYIASTCVKGLYISSEVIADHERLHKLLVQQQVANYEPFIQSPETRDSRSLNGVYAFCLDDDARGFDEDWFEASLKSKCKPDDLYLMPVPSAMNDVASDRRVRDYVGWMWYERSFTVNYNQQREHYVHFENVNYIAVVWARLADTNSQSLMLGTHVGGHLPFTLNLDALLDKAQSNHMAERIGGQQQQLSVILTIAVSNLLAPHTIPSGDMVDLTHQVGRKYLKFEPDFDFFNFAGILGDVELISVAPVHFRRVEYIGRELSSFMPRFKVCLKSQSKDSFSSTLRVKFEILADDASINLKWSKAINPSHHHMSVEHSHLCFEVHMPHSPDLDQKNLWYYPSNLDNTRQIKDKLPRLLRLRAQLWDQNSPDMMDVIETRFGIRSGNQWTIDPKHGLVVDDHRKQLQGFGMHHEELFSGRTMHLPAIHKEMYLLKQMGANLLRTSHYPYSRAYLDACDEHGIMVIAETPAVGLQTFDATKLLFHKQILVEMMHRDHNHPSIIMWSLANEPRSQLEEARDYFESLARFARVDLASYTVDVNRPLTAAIAQLHADDKIAHTLDVIMINRYYGWYSYTGTTEAIKLPLIESLRGWASKHPNKPLIVSEFGADTLPGLHSMELNHEMFSEEYQSDLLLEYERVFDSIFTNTNLLQCAINDTSTYPKDVYPQLKNCRSNISTGDINFWGSMVWNFADFSTHDSLSRPGGNRKGVFTRDRRPKVAAGALRAVYKGRL